MRANDRRLEILKKLNENGTIDVDLLASDLGVSNMTIRRDLDYLEKQNKVIRTFGGAIPASKLVSDSSFQMKEAQFNQEKQAIAQKAMECIKDNATILLDSGTTNLEIAKRLVHRQDVTVITNDIKIATVLMESKNPVIILGGELQNSTGAITGSLTEQLLEKFNVDIAFIGAHAVDQTMGISVPTIEKAILKEKMMKIASETVVVVDSSKFNKKSLVAVCEFSLIDRVITDASLSEQDLQQYEEYFHIDLA